LHVECRVAAGAAWGSGGPNIGQNPTVGPMDRVRVDSTGRVLTTNQGVPVADNQSSLKAGLRGPTLLEDFILREKITHFDHERLVGNNMPVFFTQDAMKFPDLVHAAKPEPHFGMPQAGSAHDTFWDFASLMPEITHMLMWAMSDRAIPRSYRTMQGFGVHTYRLVNAKGESCFVKFHWNPKAGTHSLVWDEAVKISGADSDFHRRDLWESIEVGAYPEWELGLQIFTEEQAEDFSFDVLDATKLVPEELVPLRCPGPSRRPRRRQRAPRRWADARIHQGPVPSLQADLCGGRRRGVVERLRYRRGITRR